MHRIVSQRIIHFKNFPGGGGHAPGPYQETRGIRPLGTSPPNYKS